MVRGTAIVVTYNSSAWVERCLEALLAHPEWDVVVIDNASEDDTVDRASRFAGQARIFQNKVNLGFAGGVNQGVRLASGDVLVLVNPDAVAVPAALDKLAEALATYKADAAGGMLLLEGGQPQTGNMVRRLPTLGAAMAELLLLNNVWRRNPWNRWYRCLDMDHTRVQVVENPAGASLAFRRSAWEKVGGFDEDFFPVWFEDADFCSALRKAGSTIVFEPAAVFEHGGAHSVGQMPFVEHQLIWYRNLLIYFSKHHSRWQSRILQGGVVSGLLLRALLCVFSAPQKAGRKISRRAAIGAYRRAAWQCAFGGPSNDHPRSTNVPPPSPIAEPDSQRRAVNF